jgi:hypothetical protein
MSVAFEKLLVCQKAVDFADAVCGVIVAGESPVPRSRSLSSLGVLHCSRPPSTRRGPEWRPCPDFPSTEGRTTTRGRSDMPTVESEWDGDSDE